MGNFKDKVNPNLSYRQVQDDALMDHGEYLILIFSGIVIKELLST